MRSAMSPQLRVFLTAVILLIAMVTVKVSAQEELQQFIISLPASSSLLTSSFMQTHDITVLKSIENHAISLVEMPASKLLMAQSALSNLGEIEGNSQVAMHSLYVQEVGNLWHLDNICKYDFVSDDGKYNYNFLGTGVDVYVFDTGINLAHEDFEGRASRFASYSGSSCDDCNGHGTHVSGTVGGKMYGIAKNVSLFDVQVLGDDGLGDTFTVVTAIYAVADHIKKNSVGVMSLGGARSSVLRAAALYARQKGLIISASSGNSDDDACFYSPGDSPDVVTVSAHDESGKKASFSNYGSCVEVYVPGVRIRSAYIGSPTATAILSGTSMAAPIVGGILATLLEQNPALDFEASVEILRSHVKTGFTPTDAPATTSLARAAPCLTYCTSTVIEMNSTTNSIIEPAGGFKVEISGTLNAWLYFDTDFPAGTFHFTLVRLHQGTVVDVEASETNINPLFITSPVQELVYAYRIDRVSSFGEAARFTLFSEPPLLCYDTVNCSSNGVCNEDGSCACFQGFYGTDCAGNTVAFLFEYEMSLSSILFLVASLVIVIIEKRASLKKVQVDELSPLLLDDAMRYSTSRYSDPRY